MVDIDLTNGKILTHIKNIAIPSSVGFLFNTLFNVVDTYYAGKLSTEALAGMTISFPIFFIIISICSGIGSGTTALTSISIGKKDYITYHTLAFNSMVISLIIALLVTACSPLFIPLLFDISKASGLAKTLGIKYSSLIFYGFIFFIFNATINGLLSSQGDTKSYRNFLILGFFANLILDPLFIYGWFGLPKMGTRGIALATVLIQILGSFYMSYRLIKSPIFSTKSFLASRISIKKIFQLLSQSIPSTLNMLTVSIGFFVINYHILLYSGSVTVAAFGVGTRISQLILLPALGLNVAALTLTGQNYGANKYERILEAKRLNLSIGAGMMLIGGFIIYNFSPFLIRLFNENHGIIMAGTYYLQIEAFAIPTYIIINVIASTLQGLKKPFLPILIGLYRQLLMPLLIFKYLGSTLNLGIKGIWLGIVITNWSAAIIAYVLLSLTLRKLITHSQ